MKVAILDIETGGLIQTKHGLLSITVKIVDLTTTEQIDEFHSLVKPDKPNEITIEAFNCHGITLEDLEKRGVSHDVVNKAALARLTNRNVSVIVAHEASFSRRFCVARLGLEWDKFSNGFVPSGT